MASVVLVCALARGQAQPPATAPATDSARELFQKVIAGHGGAERLAKIKSVRIKTVDTPLAGAGNRAPIAVEEIIAFPDSPAHL
jgi:hypothetical protein